MSDVSFVPSQRFSGMQVIDSRGMVVGNVKDVSVNFQERNLAFLVTAKNQTELTVHWEDVMSVKDVVLLKKTVELPPSDETAKSVSPPTVQAVLICPSCGASAPGHAKFCPKCGHSLR